MAFGPCARSLEGTHISSWLAGFLVVLPLFPFGHTFGIFTLLSLLPTCLCSRRLAWVQPQSILLGFLSEEWGLASRQIIANKPCVTVSFAMFKKQGDEGSRISFSFFSSFSFLLK